MALMHTPAPELGSACPTYSLPGTDGQLHTHKELLGGKACLIMFICNHCPYVKAIEDRLVALGQFYRNTDVKIVAISSNDADHYPDDSFDKMKARAEEKNYPFPYLYDESQAVAQAFGAVCTPDFFLYDSDLRLTYRGRLDDSWKDPAQVKTEDLKAAIELTRKNADPIANQVSSMGCSIKWKT